MMKTLSPSCTLILGVCKKTLKILNIFIFNLSIYLMLYVLQKHGKVPIPQWNVIPIFNFHFINYIVNLETDGTKGGGVCIYVLNSLTTNRCNNLCVNNKHIESLFLQITDNKKSFRVGCIYRPPSGKVVEFKNFLKNAIRENKNKKIYIAGDFNINSLSYDKFRKTKLFFDMLFKFNVLPVINKPTRVTRTYCYCY